MRSYEEFAAFIKKGKQQLYPGRPLEHQTRVYFDTSPSGGPPGPARSNTLASVVIQYYSTRIIEFFVDGSLCIDVRGYTTRTTLERLNRYTPYSFYNFRPNRRKGPSYFAIDMNGGWRWYRPEPQHRRGCYLISTPDVDHTHVYTWPDKRRHPRYGAEAKSTRLHTIEWWLQEIQRRKDAQARKDAKERAFWNESRDALLRAQRRLTVMTPAGNIDPSRWQQFLRKYCHTYQTAETQICHWENIAASTNSAHRQLLNDHNRILTELGNTIKQANAMRIELESLRQRPPMTEVYEPERERIVVLS